jgi:hypothetical protein
MPRCSFCGTSTGPFRAVEGLFTVLMCAGCQALRSSRHRGRPTTLVEMHEPDQPAELLAHHDPAEPWLQWGCPLAGCGTGWSCPGTWSRMRRPSTRAGWPASRSSGPTRTRNSGSCSGGPTTLPADAPRWPLVLVDLATLRAAWLSA